MPNKDIKRRGKGKIAFDISLMKVGCPLLQATLGGNIDISMFPSEGWIIAPTKNLKVYEVNGEQLDILLERVKGRWGDV